MTHSSSALSPRAFAAPDAGFDYFATEAHHRSLAGRVIATLGGFSVVVVTGDPPVSARGLSTALSDAAGPRYTAIGFSSTVEPGRHDLAQLRRALSTSPAGGGAADDAGAPGPPLVIVENADRLSDEQIHEIFKAICDRQIAAAVLLANAELLTRLDRPALRFWLAKLLLVARLRFQDLGTDEIPAFIRHQLGSGGEEGVFTREAMTAIANVSGGDPIVVNRFSRRLLDFATATTGDKPAQTAFTPAAIASVEEPFKQREISLADEPTTRTRRGSAGLRRAAVAALCLVCAGVTAALLWHPAERKITVSKTPIAEAAAALAGGSSNGEAVPSASPMSRSLAALAGSAAEPAPTAGPVPAAGARKEAALALARPSHATPLDDPPTAAPETSPAGTAPIAAAVLGTGNPGAASSLVPAMAAAPLGSSGIETAPLVARGDSMFALGDVASARLFYERAANAGDAQAARNLAKTLDPVFLYSARLYWVRGDADRAAYWYRRARDLGAPEAR